MLRKGEIDLKEENAQAYTHSHSFMAEFSLSNRVKVYTSSSESENVFLTNERLNTKPENQMDDIKSKWKK